MIPSLECVMKSLDAGGVIYICEWVVDAMCNIVAEGWPIRVVGKEGVQLGNGPEL